jgi:hypothetical protein
LEGAAEKRSARLKRGYASERGSGEHGSDGMEQTCPPTNQVGPKLKRKFSRYAIQAITKPHKNQKKKIIHDAMDVRHGLNVRGCPAWPTSTDEDHNISELWKATAKWAEIMKKVK